MDLIANTQIGLVRSTNQDRYLIQENKELKVTALMVLDGVGGSNAGDVASAMVAEEFSKGFKTLEKQNTIEDYQEWAASEITRINQLLYKASHSKNSFEGMSTTCILAMITPLGDFYINIGDSRLYMIDHRNKLVQLSTDHSLVNDLVLKGTITLEQAKTHPMKHAVTNALGIYRMARLDISEIHLPYNMLLLCTDGLSGYVDHEIIESILVEDNSLEKKKELLSKEVDKAGAFDNFTFILMENRHG